jgi:hypothetical protein
MGDILRIVFSTTTTTELKFADAEAGTADGMTVIRQGEHIRFAIPTANVVAIERIANVAPAPPPEDEPVPADAS